MDPQRFLQLHLNNLTSSKTWTNWNTMERSIWVWLRSLFINHYITTTMKNHFIIPVIKEGNLITELDKPFGSFFMVSFEISVTALPTENDKRKVFTVLTKCYVWNLIEKMYDFDLYHVVLCRHLSPGSWGSTIGKGFTIRICIFCPLWSVAISP